MGPVPDIPLIILSSTTTDAFRDAVSVGESPDLMQAEFAGKARLYEQFSQGVSSGEVRPVDSGSRHDGLSPSRSSLGGSGLDRGQLTWRRCKHRRGALDGHRDQVRAGDAGRLHQCRSGGALLQTVGSAEPPNGRQLRQARVSPNADYATGPGRALRSCATAGPERGSAVLVDTRTASGRPTGNGKSFPRPEAASLPQAESAAGSRTVVSAETPRSRGG